MRVDVIIRTYNPRPDYLRRVLQSIREQKYLTDIPDVQVTVVDNNSPKESAEEIQHLSGEFGFRLLQEKNQGSIHAYIRGIHETNADLLIWPDDDTVLAPTYIDEAIKIYHEKPYVGVWGGSIRLELEKPVPGYIRPHLSLLTECAVDREEWSNYRNCPSIAGAGFCVRRCVANKYIENYNSSPILRITGRTDKNLFSGEDWVFCLSATDIGLAVGRFPELSLVHLIPERRTNEDYLLKVSEGHAFSLQVVHAVRGFSLVDFRLKEQYWDLWLRNVFKPSFDKKIKLARISGFIKGLKYVKEQNMGKVKNDF